ncbi:MAG TPA: DUF308 domain-containing protein [Candidatus Nitrosocosmicus sp.]
MHSIRPSSLGTVKIGLGILIIIFSIVAFFLLVSSFLPLNIELGIILFFIGIDNVITGIYRTDKYKWLILGLGLLIILIVFIAITLSLSVPSGYRAIILLAISVLVSGVARIVDGIHKESRRAKIFVTSVGIINVAVSVVILLNPSSGAVMAGRAVSLLLLISGIQMLVSGLATRKRTYINK